MLKVKPGVELGMVRPFITDKLPYIDLLAQQVYGPDVVVWISAVTDGEHMKGSKHYKGLAVDVDVVGSSEVEFLQWKNLLENGLGQDFDIVMHMTHIHIEFDT